MDSGNSGSIQSSSDGDDEYDSRADSTSTLLSFPCGHYHPSLSPSTASSSDALISPYFDSFSRPQPPPPLIPKPSPDCTTSSGFVGPSTLLRFAASNAPTIGFTLDPFGATAHLGPQPSSSSMSQQHSAVQPDHFLSGGTSIAPLRSTKKRPRASRRTPTTVLETDTSNFRAMVQEFTGVPSPPFASQAFSRPRMDLLRTAVSTAGRLPAGPDAMPGYLLKPFAQKAPITFPSASTSSSSSSLSAFACPTSITGAGAESSIGADASLAKASATAASTTATISIAPFCVSTNTINNNRPSSSSDLSGKDQNLLAMFNLEPPLPHSTAAKGSSSPNAPNHDRENSHLVISTAEATLACSQGAGGGNSRDHAISLRPRFTPAERMSPVRGGGGSGKDDIFWWFDGPDGTGGGSQGHPSASEQRQLGCCCKLNCSGSSASDHHPDKGSKNVSTTGEGKVEPWICSSD